MKRVYIVLVNWNNWQDTLECLESIFRGSYPDYSVIVCDNGSTDNSIDCIKAWSEGRLDSLIAKNSPLRDISFPPVAKPVSYVEYTRLEAERGGDAPKYHARLILVRNDMNAGFAGGNNVCLKYALSRGDFEYIWLLNNDTVVKHDALERLVRRMEQKTDAGMCGSTLLYYDMPTRVQVTGGGYYNRWIGLPWQLGRLKRCQEMFDRDHVEKWMNYVAGASMLVSKKMLQEVGLICEDYFLYFEEADWALRMKGRFSLAYANDSIVYHKVGASIGTSSNPLTKSYMCDFYNIRNRLFFTRRFYPYALPVIYLILLGSLFIRICLGKWDRVSMILKLLVNYNMPVQKSSCTYTD